MEKQDPHNLESEFTLELSHKKNVLKFSHKDFNRLKKAVQEQLFKIEDCLERDREFQEEFKMSEKDRSYYKNNNHLEGYHSREELHYDYNQLEYLFEQISEIVDLYEMRGHEKYFKKFWKQAAEDWRMEFEGREDQYEEFLKSSNGEKAIFQTVLENFDHKGIDYLGLSGQINHKKSLLAEDNFVNRFQDLHQPFRFEKRKKEKKEKKSHTDPIKNLEKRVRKKVKKEVQKGLFDTEI